MSWTPDLARVLKTVRGVPSVSRSFDEDDDMMTHAMTRSLRAAGGERRLCLSPIAQQCVGFRRRRVGLWRRCREQKPKCFL